MNLKDARIKGNIIMLICILPFIGVAVTGNDISSFLDFPFKTYPIPEPDFSHIGFFIICVCIAMPLFLIRKLASGAVPKIEKTTIKNAIFPLFGHFGMGLVILSWLISWNHNIIKFQHFVFPFLWLGYILVCNALSFRCDGKSLITEHPQFLFKLFALSSLFWWYFEFLNQFVRNWYYLHVNHLSEWEYFLSSTLAFSTVLPAVWSTFDYLEKSRLLKGRFQDGMFLIIKFPKCLVWGTIIFSTIVLAFMGVYPQFLYPFLWIAPLLIMLSSQYVYGYNVSFSETLKGRWRRLILFALAGLICGFFWELWNWKAYSKWIYTIPFVSRFHIFEMPLLGYAGYLPFGLTCACIVDFCFGGKTHEVIVSPIWTKANSLCKVVTSIGVIFIGLYIFFIPGLMVIQNLSDSNVKKGGIPKMSWDLFKSITPKIEKWAHDRIQSGVAQNINFLDVPSTEWPMFGCTYYLWALENLQTSWAKDKSQFLTQPKTFANQAIEESLNLLLDENHHTWVKTHWGDNYMFEENLFFRSLVISGVISHYNLTKSIKHLDLLRKQVLSLKESIASSPFGVTDDYPGECYPLDVLMAIAMIKKSGPILGMDHEEFLRKAKRGFSGDMLDDLGLIPFSVNSKTGEHYETSRGVANAYTQIFLKELWPEMAKEMVALSEKYFWQEKWWAKGYREYPRTMTHLDYSFEVDAGPVISGFSTAGNAFALASSRINGQNDQFQTLFLQALVTFWPLPNGTLLGPRLLSNLSHAPYLGEICILYFLSIEGDGTQLHSVIKGFTPFVTAGVLFYLGVGFFILRRGLIHLKRSINQFKEVN